MYCCRKGTTTDAIALTEMPQNSKHLICDDSSMNRNILRRQLMKMLGVEVDEANGEDEAIKQVLKNGEYQIIWLDFMLGVNEHNGGHVCKRLRTEVGYKGTIIMLTGYTDLVTQNICKQAGVDSFVPKPFNMETIKSLSEQLD